jgi:hypothetical protein
MSYTPPPEQTDRLFRAVLRSINADHYANENDPHADAEAEYATEQVAITARDLARAVDALPEDRLPIGWLELKSAETAKPATTWTGPDGAVYDLGHGLRDRDGAVWVCVGWFQPFDGSPVPVMDTDSIEHMELDCVIATFGPLEARTED